jgi:hypothetical protein
MKSQIKVSCIPRKAVQKLRTRNRDEGGPLQQVTGKWVLKHQRRRTLQRIGLT